MATIREVAESAGVSVTTVSHVVNGTRFVAPETADRVREAMRVLNYRPNRLARSLRRGETHTIGLILPDSANPFFAEYSRLLEEAAFLLDYSLVLCNSNGDSEKERRYTDVLVNNQVDGIIFMAAGEDPQSLQDLVAQNFPIVVVDRILDHIEVDTVITDNHLSGRLAGQHLLELGHRRVGIIRGPSNITPSAQRVSGLTETYAAGGHPLGPELLAVGDFHSESGYQAARDLLRLASRPTAIFACNDLMAIGALRAIHEAGLTVPDDISLVGHDDIELASYTQPSLTTISQPITDLAETSIHLLLQRMRHPEMDVQRVVLPNRLVVRQSTRSIL